MLLKELSEIILTCRERNIANEDIHALFLHRSLLSTYQHARAVHSNDGGYDLQRPCSYDHPRECQSIVAEDAGVGKMKPLWSAENFTDTSPGDLSPLHTLSRGERVQHRHHTYGRALFLQDRKRWGFGWSRAFATP